MKTTNEVIDLIGVFRNDNNTWNALTYLIKTDEITFDTFNEVLQYYKVKGNF